MAEHVVASTLGRDRSLLWPERARWLWEKLRGAFPGAFSCVLMPDHLHLVVRPGMHKRLRAVLSGFTARFGVRFEVLPPRPASSGAIAGRMMRYGFFNPWRKKMVGDPFEWPWSTLRDLVGAATPIWMPLPRIARLLRTSQQATLREVTETANLVPALPEMKRVLVADLDGVREAVGSAMRLGNDEALPVEARRLVVRASFAIGAPQVERLATELGCTARTIRRDRAAATPGLDAVLRCVGDPRLRRGPQGCP